MSKPSWKYQDASHLLYYEFLEQIITSMYFGEKAVGEVDPLLAEPPVLILPDIL
jgi:hypothetical protein